MFDSTKGRCWGLILSGLFVSVSGGWGQSVPVARSPKASIAAATEAAWPVHTLRAENVWLLNLPKGQAFDASGLLLSRAHGLLTVNDRGSILYQIQWRTGTNVADLVPLTLCFTTEQLHALRGEKFGRYDGEGIAQDEDGRIYLCEEANRWVLRCDPVAGKSERLVIDWSSVMKYFSPLDLNASFEGIAVGQGKLYVANERHLGRIIVVDLATRAVVDHFMVQPHGSKARDVHYSDLCWFDGSLYLLLRDSQCVLQVDPASHRVQAEFSFREMAAGSEVTYRSAYPTGNMEGLAVDDQHIWLVTDNNAMGRVRYPKDLRPTLFRCVRPAASGPGQAAKPSAVPAKTAQP